MSISFTDGLNVNEESMACLILYFVALCYYSCNFLNYLLIIVLKKFYEKKSNKCYYITVETNFN